MTHYERTNSRTLSQDGYDQKPNKHTFYHVTMQAYEVALPGHQHTSHHFLIPHSSDQADNDPVKVCAVTSPLAIQQKPSPFFSPRVSKVQSDQQSVTNTIYLPGPDDKHTATNWAHTNTANRHQRSTHTKVKSDFPIGVNVGFSAAMKPAGYSECVSVTEVPPVQRSSCASVCDFEVNSRYKETVNIGPSLTPAWFQSKVVCHQTTTKKNFRSSVDYVPKMKPLKYEETSYVRPKHLTMTYVSYVDYNNDIERWFTTALQLVPKTNSTNTIHNFQMKTQTAGRMTSQEEETQEEIQTNGVFIDDVIIDNDKPVGDINMNIINKSLMVQRISQPTMLISSGPDENADPSSGDIPMSHRTKMVVQSAPTQFMNNDDYVVYLQGYASTGDVITNGLDCSSDLSNGFLSDDNFTDV